MVIISVEDPKDINGKGRIMESFIDNHGLCLYNSKTSTYLHPATGTYTSFDLSICFPTLLFDYDWKVNDDLFVVVITFRFF